MLMIKLQVSKSSFKEETMPFKLVSTTHSQSMLQSLMNKAQKEAKQVQDIVSIVLLEKLLSMIFKEGSISHAHNL